MELYKYQVGKEYRHNDVMGVIPPYIRVEAYGPIEEGKHILILQSVEGPYVSFAYKKNIPSGIMYICVFNSFKEVSKENEP